MGIFGVHYGTEYGAILRVLSYCTPCRTNTVPSTTSYYTRRRTVLSVDYGTQYGTEWGTVRLFKSTLRCAGSLAEFHKTCKLAIRTKPWVFVNGLPAIARNPIVKFVWRTGVGRTIH